MLPILVAVLVAQSSGCSKDTDCKGDRICEAGVCVSPTSAPAPAAQTETPPPPPPPPPPALNAADFPKVVRHDGLVCVQTLEADGHVAEACRPEDAPPTRTPARLSTAAVASPQAQPARDDAPRAGGPRLVTDLLLSGGGLIAIAGGAVGGLPELGLSFALGGAGSGVAGLVALANLEAGFGASGAILIGSLGPALRLGHRTHALFGVAPSFIAYVVRGSGGVGLAGSLFIKSVFAVAGAFTLHVHSAMHVDASGVVFTLGGGFGVGAL